MRPLVVAMIVSDEREVLRDYRDARVSFGPAPDAVLSGLAKINAVEVHTVSCVQQPVAATATKWDKIHNHSLIVPKWGWLRGGYAGCVLAIRRKLRQIKPDIVHGQGTERYCAIAAAHSGFANVITIHGNMAELAKANRARFGSFNWFAARLENYVLPRTCGVLCNSHYTEQLVRSRSNRVWHVPNAVRAEFFGPRISQPQPGAELVNVGQIAPLKRPLELLTMAESLHRKGLRFRLTFIGPLGAAISYRNRFLQAIEVANATGFARYLGPRGVSDVVASLDSARAIVHTSVRESFGLAVAEGLARNLKLFAFGAGGVNDIAKDVEGAELLPQDDWNGLQRAIERWMANGCPIPSAAAEKMQQRYSPVRVAERHVEVYQDVVQEPFEKLS